jgi:hypothetical protein
MGDPTDLLKGDLRALARYGELAGVLGDPRDEAETRLMVMLARFLADEETATLVAVIARR